MKNLSTKTYILIILTRINLNLSYRILYPFLPSISRGLGIPFEQGALLASIRSIAGLLSPLFGRYFDKHGHKLGMLGGIGVLIIGILIFFGHPTFWIAFISFGCFGLAKAIYDPSVQAYVSSSVPYSIRARALGIIELSWSGSWFIGIPMSAILMDKINWKAPFALMGIIAAVVFILTIRLPEPATLQDQNKPNTIKIRMPLKVFLILAMSFFMMLSNENIVVVYGAWMEKAFKVKLLSLGFISLVIGMGELAGELVVTTMGDRIGKRKLLCVGLIGLALSYLLLPFIAKTRITATAGLAVMFFFSEVSIVTSFPYVSEILPKARAQILSANYASAIGGRLVGSFTGPWLWHFFSSMHVASAVSFVCVVLSISFLLCYWHLSLKREKRFKLNK